jgi:hypothetical protein
LLQFGLKGGSTMQQKHKLLLTTAAAIIIGGTFLTTSSALAQANPSDVHPMDSLVQKLAEKFGLNQSDVQAVFDESRSEMQAERQAEVTAKLDELVAAGTITSQQKQLIVDKHTQLQTERDTNRDSFRNLSADEKKAKRDAEQADLEAWAANTGIDVQYLMLGHDRGPGEQNHSLRDGQGRNGRAL